MSYITRAAGGFTIVPPLTWLEFQDSPFAPHNIANRYNPDIQLEVAEKSSNTADGILIKRSATSLVMREIDEYRAYDLIDWVQRAVDSFPGHTFDGYIECEGEDNDDMWRVYVRDGHAVKVEPQIVWPEM